MRKLRSLVVSTGVMVLLCFAGITVHAENNANDIAEKATKNSVIEKGIYADDIELSGMTAAEATKAVEQYVDSLKDKEITLEVGNNNKNNSIETTAGELGVTWSNPELIEEACDYGVKGNIIQRYKAKKDLEHENKVFRIAFDIDQAAARAYLTEQCAAYNVPAVNASLKKEDGKFTVLEGKEGFEIEVEESLKFIHDYINTEWNHDAATIALVTKVEEPKGSQEELSQVKDILGTFTTDYHSSGANRSANVANGCSLIDGTTLYPGDTFSTYETVSPFSEENGYHMAGSYLNGMVVDSLGGGICQVSTTLYNAVLRAELEVDERFNHSMIVSYVDPSADAAISGTAKDFKFTNSTQNPVYIEGITTSNKKITFTIYGVETRDANREVVYESEVLKRTVPETEKIIADGGSPVGYINVQSAHVGYVARLWKVVMENGKEISRTQVNDSTYQVAPKTATVGIAHADPAVTAAMQAAIASGSIDYVKGVVANYKAATAVPAPVDPAILAAQQAAAQQAIEQQGANQQPVPEQPAAEQQGVNQQPAEQPVGTQ